jgi:hypothetical protein
MNAGEWQDKLTQWLELMPWLWFCSLTFRPVGLSKAQARLRLRRWAAALRDELGTSDFGWFAVREFGRTGHDLHYHVLVKGLRAWHADERLEWMRRWWRIAGESQIAYYTPNTGGVAYILKNTDPSDADAIEIEIDASPLARMRSATEVNPK